MANIYHRNIPIDLMETILDMLVHEVAFCEATENQNSINRFWIRSHAFTRSTLQVVLAALCLVNTTCYKISVGRLYTDVHLSTPAELSIFRRTLTQSKRKGVLREYVKTLVFFNFCRHEHRHEAQQYALTKAQQDFTAVCNLCPNLLTSTILRSDSEYKRSLFDILRRRDPPPRAHPLHSGQVACDHLTRLVLQSPASRSLAFADLPFPRLQELVLIDFISLTYNRLDLPSSMPSLLTLRFIDCKFWGHHMPFPSHAPRLRILEVVNGVIMTRRFWNAIETVANSLQSLILVPETLAMSSRGFDFTALSNVTEMRFRFGRSMSTTWLDPVFPASVERLAFECTCSYDTQIIAYIQRITISLLKSKANSVHLCLLKSLSLYRPPQLDSSMDKSLLGAIANSAQVKLSFFDYPGKCKKMLVR